MKPILFFLLLSLTGINAYSQDPVSKDFLNNFFSKSTKIIYMDKLGEYGIKRMKKALSKDTLSNWKEPKNRLILNQQELRYIQHELEQQSKVIWSNHLFEHGIRLSEAVIDSIERTRGWIYFNEHYGSKLYSFSNPIFIRNRSLCIFYSGYTCGTRCGEGKLMILKKQNDTWLSWIELYRRES